MKRYRSKKGVGRWMADTLVAMLAIGSLFAGYMVAVAGVSDGGLDENLSSVYYSIAETVSPTDEKVMAPPSHGVFAHGASESEDSLVACDKSVDHNAVGHLIVGLDACPHEATIETTSI